MMHGRLLPLLALLGAILATVPATVSAAEPPNQNDPCSRAGRNVCDTLGVGKYDTYRYGLRWFGDYRGAIPGVKGATWCIDLRFWYPSAAFGYEKRSTAGLKNREGDAVTGGTLRRLAYATWAYGRTQSVVDQAAVMLYVHAQMGDGAPGEASPAAAGPAVERQVQRIARDARRYAGPYTVKAELPTGGLTVGKATKLRVRVLSGTGVPVPGVTVRLATRGVDGLPATVDTGSRGDVRVAFTPAKATDELEIRATTEELAAPTPALYVPTRGAAQRSGQRLIAARSATVADVVTARVAPAKVAVTTAAAPTTMLVGEQSRDTVKISGAPASWRQQVEVRLYGPARRQSEISCDGPPVATHTYEAGNGDSTTPPTTLTRPGWYGYQLTVPSTPDVQGLTTPCALPEESVKVETQPRVRTQVSAPAVDPGAAVTDTVVVEGLAGEAVTVNAALYGPFPSRDKITCDGPAVWTGSFPAAADGEYVTDPVTLTQPGYYTYRETIPATEFTRAADHPCAEVSETTIVRGRPAIRTQISAQETAPGAQVTDQVVITGLGALAATVNVELWGPYERREDMTCTGTPIHTSQFAAAGDGTYTTAPVTLPRAGLYTYRESIVASEAYEGVLTACGEAAETTLTKAKPEVVTTVSNAVVKPGASIFDTLKVTGLGQTPAKITLELFGPFETRGEISCEGTPFWKGTVDVPGDGSFTSEKVKVTKAGFYSYREKIASSPLMSAEQGRCGEEAETSLVAPLILTGRGDPRVASSGRLVTGKAAQSLPKPTHITIRTLGVDTAVRPVTIDTGSGALAVPKDISKVGWWRDGATPGDATGTTLIAGHVDSAKRGAGAFYPLRSARRGTRIVVRTEDRRERTYRVTGVRTVRKEALPTGIFTRGGPKRLVLVTCGGPFDQQSGHYRDNVIVTAVPAA
ncbi:hypothetical protein C7Y72_20480 [Paraconexibacter algicola]|uniref:Sortase n=2 Tax=Paraconexibacter algicola TaxID=2133960 RepID=A0A2T4UCK3_9ACTN|nr:hypothetical protein C7Y72_20480 [Paraconexibacter algicola]